jgi:hypothetical protein
MCVPRARKEILTSKFIDCYYRMAPQVHQDMSKHSVVKKSPTCVGTRYSNPLPCSQTIYLNRTSEKKERPKPVQSPVPHFSKPCNSSQMAK